MMRADSICWQVEKLGFNIAAMLSLLSLWWILHWWRCCRGSAAPPSTRWRQVRAWRPIRGEQCGVWTNESSPGAHHLAERLVPPASRHRLLSVEHRHAEGADWKEPEYWQMIGHTHTHLGWGGAVSYWGGVMIRPTHFIKQTLLGGHILGLGGLWQNDH